MNRVMNLVLALFISFVVMGQSECVGNDPTPTPSPTPTMEPTLTPTPSITPTPTSEPTPTPVDSDNDGWDELVDCDDFNSSVYPGAPEVCNDYDDSCDGEVDEALEIVWYLDADGDGYGDEHRSIIDCAQPADYYVQIAGDCADLDPDIHPGVGEVCDGMDQDCDGNIDEAVQTVFYFDADQDGYGDPDDFVLACSVPNGYVDIADDCDPIDPDIHPGAHDICNDGVDQDCDEEAKECDLSGTYDLEEIGVKLYGESDNSHAGESISSAGDVNNDGFDDILVGTEYVGSDGVAVYLVYGPVSGTMSLADADAKFTGANYSSFYPFSVASAGDVNADQFDDILIWSHGGDESTGSQSVSYLIYGPVYGTINIATQAHVKFIDWANRAVAGAGDVNNDGFDDILLGSSSGVCLVYGRTDLLGTISLADADVKFVSDTRDAYGDSASISLAGDVNNDGFDDILIGSAWNDEGDAGTAYLIYGRSDLSGSVNLADADARFIGGENGDYIGRVSAGDVNNDGFDDILLGCSDEVGTNTGAACLVYGPVSGTMSLADADAKFVGVPGDHIGHGDIAIAGDVNGDGDADILLSAQPFSSTGIVYLVYGPVSGTMSLADADAKFVGASNTAPELSVAGAGDVNMDGFTDILIGAPWSDSYYGRVYLIYGGN